MIILGQSQGFPSRTFIFCRSQCPFDWESYAEVMQCLVPIMLCKTSFFIIKLYPLIVNLHLHTSVPKFNPIKELRNGGGIFIFNGFCLRSFTKIAHTTKCFKLSTLGRLPILIPICCITSFLKGMLWSFTWWYFFNISLLLTLVVFFKKFSGIWLKQFVFLNLFQIVKPLLEPLDDALILYKRS